MTSTFGDLMYLEGQHRNSIQVERVYVDITGDFIAGLLLSQIVYWFLPNETWESKLDVHKNGKRWLVKTRADWWDECRLTARQFDRAAKVLTDKGIIETKLFKHNGNPTIHIWLNIKKLVALCKAGQALSSPPDQIPGHIYVLKGESGWYKIGRTKNLKSRMHSFNSLPIRWELALTIETEDTVALENKLHETFADKRRGKRGEWFALSHEDIEFLSGGEVV